MLCYTIASRLDTHTVIDCHEAVFLLAVSAVLGMCWGLASKQAFGCCWFMPLDSMAVQLMALLQ